MMTDTKSIETQEYKTLDKDYGRTKMVGNGYGEINAEQYKLLEELAK